MKLNPSIPQRVFFIAMSIFLVHQSYQTLIAISHYENISWSAQLLLAGIINLFVTGIFAFAVFGSPIEQLFPLKYYRIQNPKTLKSWFKKLGGERFRNFLLATVWRKKEMQKDFFDGTLKGISTFERKTKKSEFGHLLPLVIISLVCIYLVMKNLFWAALFTMVINIIFNFYPVLLQRHHRMRLARLKKILEAKKNAKS